MAGPRNEVREVVEATMRNRGDMQKDGPAPSALVVLPLGEFLSLFAAADGTLVPMLALYDRETGSDAFRFALQEDRDR